MSSAIPVTLTVESVASDSVEILASLMYGSDTGVIIVYDGTSTEVARSSSITLSSSSSSEIITGLSAGTNYTASFYSTVLSDINSNVLSFSTSSVNHLYGSVNGVTKTITKLYGSVNGVTKQIDKLYGSVGGVTKRLF